MDAVRRSPVAVFSVVSLVTMASLAAVLGFVLQDRIRARALDNAADKAGLLGEIAVRRYIPEGELRGGRISYQTTVHLDDHLQGGQLASLGVKEVEVFNPKRELVYSSAGEPVGNPEPPSSSVAVALRGERVKTVAKGTDDDGSGEEVMSVYSPLRYQAGAKPAGAFEVYLDYTAAAAATRNDIWTMWGLVAGGFVVLWLALFRLVGSVSGALRSQMSENRRQATHDALTGLPNRTLLFERVGAAVAQGTAALLIIDLDGFREINDTLGHDHGDELLVDVATRLSAAAGEGDIVARLGGDEFGVLRPRGATEEEARVLAAALVDTLRTPMSAGGTAVVVDASVGVALAPQHGSDAATIVRRAEVAMYVAKRRRSSVELYDVQRDHTSRDRLALLGELGGAIRRGELVLAYQPKVTLGPTGMAGEVQGVEALVRWQHPEHGLIPPGQFVPAAELTSLVRPLTLHVVDAALRTYRGWYDRGIELPIAVNLAGPCVMDVGIPGAVADLLADHGVPATALTLEISEETMMSDLPGALKVLEDLRTLGVRLSLDDFGTGQTSLGQLRQLPLDEMKIDRSLVIGDRRLLSSVVDIAHRFGLEAVGEGIETPEIARALADAGCDLAQGFLFARPMWADDVVAWVTARDVAAA
ncbi:MAG TPA: EAL domain-containing protein [Solirubrobacteraceae bacterium]|nr:EAL domain-containing protein [Solirubrobacteraceae bacterium]